MKKDFELKLQEQKAELEKKFKEEKKSTVKEESKKKEKKSDVVTPAEPAPEVFFGNIERAEPVDAIEKWKQSRKGEVEKSAT